MDIFIKEQTIIDIKYCINWSKNVKIIAKFIPKAGKTVFYFSLTRESCYTSPRYA